MNDKYKFETDGVDKSLATLQQIRGKYDAEITKMTNLARTIDASPLWKDLKVKTKFIETFNSYISIYKDACSNMERYEKYLEKKSDDVKQIEQKYSR